MYFSIRKPMPSSSPSPFIDLPMWMGTKIPCVPSLNLKCQKGVIKLCGCLAVLNVVVHFAFFTTFEKIKRKSGSK